MTLKDTIVNAIKSPRFWGAFFLGQLLSFCLTIMNVTTSLISGEHGIDTPATQCLGNYIILTLVFATYTVYEYGISRYSQVIKERGLLYVEASYFLVKGLANASYLSAYLIFAFSSPRSLLYNYMVLRKPHQSTQLVGLVFAVTGMTLLLLSNILSEDRSKDSSLMNDLYCVIASVLYSAANTLEESCIRKYPNWEILGFLGLFGTLINFSQLMILERQEFETITWTPGIIGLYIIFTIAMFCLYSLVPVLISMTNAMFYNISLLTSDFYGLIIGFFTFQTQANPLCPYGFVLVIVSLLIYNMSATSTGSHSVVPILIESELAIYRKNSSVRSLLQKPSAKTDLFIPSFRQKLSGETNDDLNS